MIFDHMMKLKIAKSLFLPDFQSGSIQGSPVYLSSHMTLQTLLNTANIAMDFLF